MGRKRQERTRRRVMETSGMSVSRGYQMGSQIGYSARASRCSVTKTYWNQDLYERQLIRVISRIANPCSETEKAPSPAPFPAKNLKQTSARWWWNRARRKRRCQSCRVWKAVIAVDCIGRNLALEPLQQAQCLRVVRESVQTDRLGWIGKILDYVSDLQIILAESGGAPGSW